MDVRNKETGPSSGSLFFLALLSHAWKRQDAILSSHGQTGWLHACGPGEDGPYLKV